MLGVLVLAMLLAEQAVDPHVRTFDPRLQALITTATDRSLTFRSLMARLKDSDVIVYLEVRDTRDGLRGVLLHRVMLQGAYRYLRLIINPHDSDERLMAVIAHELQHALEIAKEREAGRSEAVRDLFARIGFRFGCPGCYETTAAIDVERTVREELNVSRPTGTDKN
jgi:hypothetical protein